jgi:hypothetical protein
MVRLLDLVFLLPLVQTIRDYQAATAVFEGVAVHWLLSDGLDARVEGELGRLLGPAGNEALAVAFKRRLLVAVGVEGHHGPFWVDAMLKLSLGLKGTF